MSTEFVSLVFNLNIFKSFFYKVPHHLASKIASGMRVRAPFGPKDRIGIVTKCHTHCVRSDLKTILEVIDERTIVSKEMMDLALWISEYYYVSLGEALFAMFPSHIKNIKRPLLKDNLFLNNNADFCDQWKQKNKRKKTILSLLDLFQKKSIWTVSDLKKNFPHKKNNLLIQQLLDDNILQWKAPQWTINDSQHVLNEEQMSVYTTIKTDSFYPYLLHGVTGSGKTEIYLHVVKDILKMNRSALILVPEIALTQQIYNLFHERFPHAVSLLHSHLTLKDRSTRWWQIKNGETPVVIGSRSAIFAPLNNLGVIIVDEEHESSYKQEDKNPRYSARDLAIVRAKKNNIPVILGSATPSLESFYNTEIKKYSLLTLSQRIGTAKAPKALLIDMRYDPKKNFFISRLLFEKICLCLKNKEQIILFLNKRGFYKSLFCEKCATAIQCSSCSVSLTYHQTEDHLKCHYCGATQVIRWTCSSCNSKLKTFGFGIQALEQNIQSLFPHATTARLDTDIAQKAGELERILNDFSNQSLDILIGTQMIAKGIDIHNVTLVGVIHADTGIFLPDFRASEKTYQLIQQVAGRSGRGAKSGEVIIQTYQPQNPILQFALKGNFLSFYKEEMKDRKLLFYPPYARLVEVLIVSSSEKDIMSFSKNIQQTLSMLMQKENKISIMGPVPMPLNRIKQKFRWHIMIKSTSNKAIQNALKVIQTHNKKSSIKLLINRDPLSIM